MVKTASGELTPPTETAGSRACPFCGEQVLTVAIKCKHCGSTIEPVPAVIPETLEEAAERLGLKRAGHLFLYQDFQCTRLEDAVDYAKRAAVG